MVALSLSDKFCCFCIFVFNRFLFSRFSFHHFFVLVLVFVNEFVIFSFFTILVFVNENHTGLHMVQILTVEILTFRVLTVRILTVGQGFDGSPDYI